MAGISSTVEQVGQQAREALPKLKRMINKQSEVVAFSSLAIALYGYDQGMMSLINTNYNYLSTMGIGEESIMVSVIVSVYYIGCAVGAVLASRFADWKGRRPSIFASLAVTILGNLMMFVSGLGGWGAGDGGNGLVPMILMLAGRTIMGLGVGGIDAVIPVYTAELSGSGDRGSALAKEFQANILGLNIAFALNLACTTKLGKYSEWAWRIPIIFMNTFPVALLSVITRLPESPRWCVHSGEDEQARRALEQVYGKGQDADDEFEELKKINEESSSHPVHYFRDMLLPSGAHFHATTVTIMGQVNQALTGIGAISVYGPQIFELLGFSTSTAEFITLGNYLQYLAFMTFAWLLIDRLGRRTLMVWGSVGLTVCLVLLTICGGVVYEGLVSSKGDAWLGPAIPGCIILYAWTSIFGITWLVPPWLIPTEIYPSSARAQGAAVSVIVWGLANFAVTFLTPPIFNSLNYWLYLIFAATNAFAGWWTYVYCPESGGRSFEENVSFFDEAKSHGTWAVSRIKDGEFCHLPHSEKDGGKKDQDDESSPLLGSTP